MWLARMNRSSFDKKIMVILWDPMTFSKFDLQLFCRGVVQEKFCFFFQFTATDPLHVKEQLILARGLSVWSLLLDGHFLQNQQQSGAGEGEVEKFRKLFLK